MTYPGGKDGAGVWQGLINQIPPHDVWISGFAGDCAVTRHIRPAAASILCDLDAEVLRRWIVRRRPQTRLLNVDCVQWLRFAFDLDCLQEATPDPAAADAEVCGARASWRPGCVAYFRGLVPAALAAGSAVSGSAVGSRIAPSVFCYLDPPYLPATRRDPKRYRHEMSALDHERLLSTIIQLPCFCLIHGYPSDLYSASLQEWRTWTYRAMTRRGMRLEQCWTNYCEPAQLHDYRYVGKDKRQRERVRRRTRNWVSGLKRAPAQERGAILQAIESGGW